MFRSPIKLANTVTLMGSTDFKDEKEAGHEKKGSNSSRGPAGESLAPRAGTRSYLWPEGPERTIK